MYINATLAYSSSFLLGALHALEPGHGKSFLAAFIVGEKLKVKHILVLAGSMLTSHFLMLTVIALVLKYVFADVGSETIFEFNRWVMPFAIIGFGLYLVYRSLTQKGHTHDDCCGHDHGHSHGHSHHHKVADVQDGGVKKVALVGLISGFLPCPTAIVPVMIAGATDNFSNAVLYIFIYVIGMSVVLGGLALVFYYTKDYLASRFEKMNEKINPQLISAILVLLVGVVYLGYQMMGHSH